MKCLYSNADQLLNKMEDLKMVIASDSPDIMMITEVIPKAQKNPILESQMIIPGYVPYVNFNYSDLNLGASVKKEVWQFMSEKASPAMRSSSAHLTKIKCG